MPKGEEMRWPRVVLRGKGAKRLESYREHDGFSPPKGEGGSNWRKIGSEWRNVWMVKTQW